MLPAFLTALRQTHETNGHISTFVEGINCALSRRFFDFSNCTAAFFFEPGSPNFNELFRAVSNVFEQNIMRDALDIVRLLPDDIKTKGSMPMWAGSDLQPFAEQFIRPATMHQSSFVNSITARIISPVKHLLEKSHRPNAANELRAILYAFCSCSLLTKALTSPVAVISQAYLQRVIQHFATEPVVEQVIHFNGPMNQAAAYGLTDEPFYTPVRTASREAHAALAKILVAAHRTLCCLPGSASDIAATTNFVVSFLYTPYVSIWTSSRASIPVKRVTTAAAPTAPTIQAAPTPTCGYRADIVAPPTPRPGAPKTPSAAAGRAPPVPVVKNTLRVLSPNDTF